jgi:hypothetical protein
MSNPAFLWPEFAGLGPAQQSRPAWAGTVEARCRPGRLHPGGPAPPSSWPAHPGLSAAAPLGHPGLRARLPVLAGPELPLPAGPGQFIPGWDSALLLQRVKWPPLQLSRAAIGRAGLCAVGWAVRGQAAPAIRHLPRPCQGVSG